MRKDGAIYITNSDNKHVLTSETLFFNSLSSKFGGSLFVGNSACIQYRICSVNSSTSGTGCHSYVYTSQNNFIIESSVAQGGKYESAVCLYNGNQLIDSTNVSFTKCYSNAAYILRFSERNTSPKINYSTINNNTYEVQCTMYHGTGTHLVCRCNILNNAPSSTNYGWGIVYCDSGCIDFKYCHLVFNTGYSLFYNNGDQIIVKDCFIDDNNYIKTISIGNEFNIITTKFFEQNLEHLSTQKCVATYKLLRNRFSKYKIDTTAEILYSHTHFIFEVFIHLIT